MRGLKQSALCQGSLWELTDVLTTLGVNWAHVVVLVMLAPALLANKVLTVALNQGSTAWDATKGMLQLVLLSKQYKQCLGGRPSCQVEDLCNSQFEQQCPSFSPFPV
jgi:hypothetical protein